MSQPELCSYCSKISFQALRTPHNHEIEDIISGKSTGLHLSNPTGDETISKVSLGPLSRIERDSSFCKLCALFSEVVSRQGGVYNIDRTLHAEDIVFRADPDVSYYGYISAVGELNSATWVPRRLSLTAHFADDPNSLIAYFDHILQACDIETELSIPSEIKTLDGKQMSAMQFGGRRRPLQVDVELLKRWMQICQEEHSSSCAFAPSQKEYAHFECIRFLDVKQMCVRELKNANSSDIKFVTLSYVWGSAQIIQPVKLENQSKSAFELPFSLTKLVLPQTITDALDVCHLIGVEYLWVDALCIIQDNLDDQNYQIRRMADIYSTAFLTIIAAFGDNSNAGLPGLRPGTRFYTQRSAVVIPQSHDHPGLSLMTTVKSHPQHWDEHFIRGLEDIDSSKWNSRAWTMQERALSRRNLIFTKEQVLWTCPMAYFCEESHFEVPLTRFRHFSHQTVHNLGITGAKATWEYYRYLVERYTGRDMTFDGDVFDAFQAVVVGLERISGHRFFWGLPVSRFDLAMSWDTFYGLKRRTAVSKLPMTSLNTNVVFPSWSWMGWVGQAHCSVCDDRLESESPQIVCYTHRSKPLRFLPVQNASHGDARQAPVVEANVEKCLPWLTPNRLALFPDDYLLFFWADSAFFTVKRPEIPNKNHTSFSDHSKDIRPTIQTAAGKIVGRVCKDATEALQKDDDGGTKQSEFIAVGKRAVPEVPNYSRIILALQVEWKDGIAYRVNIGEIEEAAWLTASPKRSLVVLG